MATYADDSEQAEGGGVMAGITVPIKVDLPDNWLEMVVDRLRNDPDGEWAQVIRCKDCKHKHLENMVWTCPFGLPGGENFFCGYGAEPYKGEQE